MVKDPEFRWCRFFESHDEYVSSNLKIYLSSYSNQSRTSLARRAGILTRTLLNISSVVPPRARARQRTFAPFWDVKESNLSTAVLTNFRASESELRAISDLK